ncbi:MAG: ATP-dependent DNA helicase, partial [Alistipes sp.]|nr:ATP-dependent DNA helicase [Alistipes sp.]
YKWGSMDFCRPSRFLSEIDPAHLDIAFDLADEAVDVSSALKKNYQAHNARAASSGWGGAGSAPRPRNGGSDGYGQGKPVYGREASRYGSRPGAGDTEAVRPVIPTGRNLRSVGVTVKKQGEVTNPRGGTVAEPGQLVAGARVEHQKFGVGTVDAVEQTAGDQKITVLFDDTIVGRKTLLGKYARLTIVE